MMKTNYTLRLIFLGLLIKFGYTSSATPDSLVPPTSRTTSLSGSVITASAIDALSLFKRLHTRTLANPEVAKVCAALFENPEAPVTIKTIWVDLAMTTCVNDAVPHSKDVALHKTIIDGVVLDAVKRLNDDPRNAQWVTARLVTLLLLDTNIASIHSWLYSVRKKAESDDTSGKFLSARFCEAAAIFPKVLLDNSYLTRTYVGFCDHYGVFMQDVFKEALYINRIIEGHGTSPRPLELPAPPTSSTVTSAISTSAVDASAYFERCHKGKLGNKEAAKVCADLFENPETPVAMKIILDYLGFATCANDVAPDRKQLELHRKIIDGVVLDAVKRLNDGNGNGQWVTARLLTLLLLAPNIPSTHLWLHSVNKTFESTKTAAFMCLGGTPKAIANSVEKLDYLDKEFCGAAAIFPKLLLDSNSLYTLRLHGVSYSGDWDDVWMLDVLEGALALALAQATMP